MARRLWLIFAQTVTVFLALLGLLNLIAPNWRPNWKGLSGNSPGIELLRETTVAGGMRPVSGYREAAAKALPSIVNVYTTKEIRLANDDPFQSDPLFRRFFGAPLGPQTERSTSLGSGVIVDGNGYIVTNHHVIEAASEIAVELADGRRMAAQLVGSDPDTDVALLKINASNLPPIHFGDSRQVQVGDVVLAIGNPFRIGQTVTQGIVSALGRSKLGINTFEQFIQTDAPINPGNSGGALVDTQGRLIGINTAIFSKSGGSLGIGFAIPEQVVREVLKQLIEHGEVVRGWIGISTQDLTPELAASFNRSSTNGTLVTGLLAGAPGALAGLRPGDIILQINGQPVTGSDNLRNRIAALPPGAIAEMQIERRGEPQQLRITVLRRPSAARVLADD